MHTENKHSHVDVKTDFFQTESTEIFLNNGLGILKTRHTTILYPFLMCGFFSPPQSNSPSLAECPTIQLNSDTIYPKTVSDSRN